MAIADYLLQMMGLKPDPTTEMMGGAPPVQTAALSPAPVIGGGGGMSGAVPAGAPAGGPGAGGFAGLADAMRAAGVAAGGARPGQPPAPGPMAGGPPTAAPGAAQPPPAPTLPGAPVAPSPPDLTSLYQKMLSDAQQRDQINSGATLLAAGFAAPGNREALIGQAGKSSSSVEGVGQQLKTMLELQQIQTAQKQKQEQLARLPIIAKQYNIPIEVATELFQNGKLDDVLTKLAQPDNELKTLNNGDTVLTSKRDGRVIANLHGRDNTVKGVPVTQPDGTTIFADPSTGKPIQGAAPIGTPKVNTQSVTFADGSVHLMNSDTGKEISQMAPAAKHHQVITFSNGNSALLDTDTGQVIQSLGGAKPDPTPEKVQVLKDARSNWQERGLPDPNAPENQTFWQNFGANVLGGGKTQMFESAFEKAHSEGLAKAPVEAMNQAQSAQEQIGQLSQLKKALDAGGDFYTGPAADWVIKSKEALAGVFGTKFENLAPSEVVQKLGFGLATMAVKAISNRPSQLEFTKGLENVPGIFLSQAGSRAMIAISTQAAHDKINLAVLAQDPEKAKHWPQTVAAYYADPANAIKSPFDPTRAFDQRDVDELTRQAKTFPAPGQTAVDLLKKNPGMANKFDAIHGPGASKKVLGDGQ